MDDSEFLRLFHEGALTGDEFRHRGHLRLAWLVLSRHPRDEAEQIVASEILRFAIANGASNRYHDTLTRFWVRLLSHAMENAPEARSIDELLSVFPFLLEKSLPYRHWRTETFNSDPARTGWVEPDLVPLP
jgi:type VI protein secretion system component VasK